MNHFLEGQVRKQSSHGRRKRVEIGQPLVVVCLLLLAILNSVQSNLGLLHDSIAYQKFSALAKNTTNLVSTSFPLGAYVYFIYLFIYLLRWGTTEH